MSFDGSDRIGSEFYSDAAPDYGLLSRDAAVSIGVATALIAGTLGLLWIARGTRLAFYAIWLYAGAPFAPWTGILVFGAVLTGGRYYGIRAAVSENYGLAFGASAAVGVAYAAFGAGILSLYGTGIHVAAVAVATATTVAITLGAATLVYTTGWSFANWDAYSGGTMIAGIVVLFFARVVAAPSLLWVAFGLILLGWIVDLVYEIYMVSDANRSPVANGIGVYVAFMGVFVHVLQLVLRAMAESE